MAMSSRTKRSWTSALLAALLLFAQFAVASQFCVAAHEECGGVPMSDQACVAQCVAQADQTVSSPDHHFDAMPAAASIAWRDFPLVATRVPARPLGDAPLPAGPTLQVLFCSYQT